MALHSRLRYMYLETRVELKEEELVGLSLVKVLDGT